MHKNISYTAVYPWELMTLWLRHLHVTQRVVGLIHIFPDFVVVVVVGVFAVWVSIYVV